MQISISYVLLKQLDCCMLFASLNINVTKMVFIRTKWLRFLYQSSAGKTNNLVYMTIRHVSESLKFTKTDKYK